MSPRPFFPLPGSRKGGCRRARGGSTAPRLSSKPLWPAHCRPGRFSCFEPPAALVESVVVCFGSPAAAVVVGIWARWRAPMRVPRLRRRRANGHARRRTCVHNVVHHRMAGRISLENNVRASVSRPGPDGSAVRCELDGSETAFCSLRRIAVALPETGLRSSSSSSSNSPTRFQWPANAN